MRKSFLAAGTALLAFSALSVATHARDLTVVSWGGAYQDAQREAYFGPYTKASGNKVLDEAYNGETAKIKAMVETNNVTWDVVQMEAPELENSCDEGLLEVVNWEKLGGQDTVIDPAIIGECGVGTILWSVILAYDSEKLGQDGPKSWADMWDVKKWPGKRALRKTAKFTLEIALMADGVPADKVYETLATKEGIDRAFKKLDEIKEHIQWWESGAQPPQWLASGDVVMTTAYNGRISKANDEGRKFNTSWNGQIYALDGWAIVKGTPNADKAYDFIKSATQPKAQAQLSAKIPYGPTHKDAVAAADEKTQKRLPSNPAYLEGALASNTDFWVENVEDLNQRFNNWASR